MTPFPISVFLLAGLLAAPVLAQAPSPKATAPPPPATSKLTAGPASADVPSENADTPSSGPALPIPRFVSFRADPVNMRTGPGVRYPVDWVYMRRYLPVEIIAEFETWRQIRDPDGTEGWVHQSMLSGRRTAMVRGEARPLQKANNELSEILATVEQGVIVDVLRCPDQGVFCRVEISGLQGWLRRDQMWGVYPTETVE